jgi:hypothetical protein
MTAKHPISGRNVLVIEIWEFDIVWNLRIVIWNFSAIFNDNRFQE